MAVSIPSRLAAAALLERLADGGLHCTEELAAQLRSSRAAVAKAITRLRSQGVEVHSSRGRYRLPHPVELLDAGRIRAVLTPDNNRRLRALQLRFEVGSTNTCLLEAPAPPVALADACLQGGGTGSSGIEFGGGCRGIARAGARRSPGHGAQMAE